MEKCFQLLLLKVILLKDVCIFTFMFHRSTFHELILCAYNKKQREISKNSLNQM